MWKPALGQDVLVIKADSAPPEQLLLSAPSGASPAGFSAGEVYIYSNKASVYIKNDGVICISGEVEIEGSLTVNGIKYSPCMCGM